MVGPIVRTYDKRIWKKCIKCRGWHPREDILNEETGEVVRKHGFGNHADSSDGLQSICFFCKNAANNKARSMNVTARIRHHTGTRCLTQLGKKLTPPKFVANLEDYLGYKFPTLVKALSKDLKTREGPKRKLRDALNEGYHIDHIIPLSSFKVVTLFAEITDGGLNDVVSEGVDWDVFRECWAITNLRAIPAEENLAKGATYDTDKAPTEKTETETEAQKDMSIDISAETEGGDPGAPD